MARPTRDIDPTYGKPSSGGSGQSLDSPASFSGPRRPRNKRRKQRRGSVGGGVEDRARQRLDQIGPVGGVNAKDGITRPEAQKVRRAWQTERRFDPTRPRTGRDISSEAEALVELEYGPQRKELEREGRNSAGRANVMAGWFQQYQDTIAQQARETAIQNQAFQQGQLTAAATAFQADTQGVSDRQTQANAQGAKFGFGADQTVALQAQQAAGARQQQGIAAGGAIGQVGAAATSLMGQRAANAGQQRIEVLADEQARAARIDELGRELAASEGAAKTKYVGQLKESERQYGLERSAFGLDVAEARNDAADDRADNRRQSRNDRFSRRDRRLDNQRADRTEARNERNTNSLIQDRQEDNARAERQQNRSVRKNDPDGDGVANGGRYRGYSESERDKFDQAVRLLRAKGTSRSEGQTALNALIDDKNIPARIAKRALRFHLRKARNRQPKRPKNNAYSGPKTS